MPRGVGAGAHPVRRPMAGACLVFLAGLGLGLLVPLPFGLLWAAAGLVLLVSLAVLQRAGSVFLIWALCFILACLHGQMAAWNPSHCELARLMRRPAEHVEVVVVAEDDAQVREGRTSNEVLCLLPARVEGVRRMEDWQRARGWIRVRVHLPSQARRPQYGERWYFQGLVKPERKAGDGAGWTRYRMEAGGASACCLSERGGSRFRAWCFRRRRACHALLGRGLEAFPEQAGVLRALLLGYRGELPAERNRDFSVTGTLHIFAISGTHVGVMAVLCALLLKSAGIARNRWLVFLLPILVMYTTMTGLAPSAVRACIMALVFLAADYAERKPDSLTALALAALLILSAAPLQWMEPGFILSFTAVLGLILLYPVFCRLPHSWLQPEPWLPAPEPVWKSGMRALGGRGLSLAAASLAAWLVTTPLTARYFNLFSPVALAANLFVIPSAFLIMLTGVLSLAGGLFFPGWAEVFNHANRVFITALLKGIEWAAEAPGGHFFVRSPPGWLLAAWYGFLLAGVWGARRRAGWMLAALAACGVAAGAWHFSEEETMTLDLLDVGQGNAALVNVPGSQDLLVDTGSRFYALRVVQHLRRQGVRNLRALVLSHADSDHMGGAREILSVFPVEELWCPPVTGRSPVYQETLEAAEARGVRIRRMVQGQRGALAGGGEWEVLFPPETGPVRSGDEACLVLRVGRNAVSALLMSDAGEAAGRQMLSAGLEVSARVLVAGGHGADTATTEAWLEAVDPEVVVLSIGADNTQGLPDRNLLERLRARGLQVHRTDEQGTLRILFPPGTPRHPLPSVEIHPVQ